MTDTTISKRAGEAFEWFEIRERGERGEKERFITLKDGRPQWVLDLCQTAHADMFPDDYRYEAIRDALAYISDNDADEDGSGDFADSHVDVYNTERSKWLYSRLDRAGYVDDAANEYGFSFDNGKGVFDLLGMGQYSELSEVYGFVYRFLVEME